MQDSVLKKQYRWQCRRGLKEVEVVLNGYLERFFDEEPEERRELFGRLLKEQDADLFEWFTRRSRPADEELAEFILSMLRQLGRPD